jgi:hypothetical protein
VTLNLISSDGKDMLVYEIWDEFFFWYICSPRSSVDSSEGFDDSFLALKGFLSPRVAPNVEKFDETLFDVWWRFVYVFSELVCSYFLTRLGAIR